MVNLLTHGSLRSIICCHQINGNTWFIPWFYSMPLIFNQQIYLKFEHWGFLKKERSTSKYGWACGLVVKARLFFLSHLSSIPRIDTVCHINSEYTHVCALSDAAQTRSMWGQWRLQYSPSMCKRRALVMWLVSVGCVRLTLYPRKKKNLPPNAIEINHGSLYVDANILHYHMDLRQTTISCTKR